MFGKQMTFACNRFIYIYIIIFFIDRIRKKKICQNLIAWQPIMKLKKNNMSGTAKLCVFTCMVKLGQ